MLKGPATLEFHAADIHPEALLADRPVSGTITADGTASLAGPSLKGASAEASVRLPAPSLAITLETCTLTVLAEMNSCCPISPLLRPAATSARISRSRGVSAPASAAPARRVEPRYPILCYGGSTISIQ